MNNIEISQEQLSSFKRIWQGGYFGGDPLDPTLAWEYGDISLISVNYALYMALVRPNINSDTALLEIGPGRGAWTRGMLDAKEVWCLDALSAEHNGFWSYIGNQYKEKVNYFQVKNALLEECPDNYFDFIFSFGAFCHMPLAIQRDYQKNLFKKARPSARGVIMFSDFDKLNSALNNLSALRTVSLTWRGISAMIRFNVGRFLGFLRNAGTKLDKNDKSDQPGRFYHSGITDTAAYMTSVGWRVISPDIGLNLRDPIIYFEKPRS